MRTAEPCFYCGEPTAYTPEHSDSRRTVDHVVPLALGGSKGGDNVVVACGWCNKRKTDMLHHEWVTWLACIDLARRDRVFRRKATAVLNRWWYMVIEPLERPG